MMHSLRFVAMLLCIVAFPLDHRASGEGRGETVQKTWYAVLAWIATVDILSSENRRTPATLPATGWSRLHTREHRDQGRETGRDAHARI